MEHFAIIQALCRSALSNPNSAVIHQVERLKNAYEKDGNTKEAKALGSLLSGVNKALDMAPSKIERSFVFAGEELTPRTPLPVDKETSTPLAEVIFVDQETIDPPIFNEKIGSAIRSVLSEWQNHEALSKIGAYPSKSCLIYGRPGTGKTKLAMWLAQQMGMPVVIARLDGLMSSFLGTTSRNIGNLFDFANKYRCILLLDEFDSIAKLRNDPQEVGEIKRVVNTLLQNLDVRKRVGFTIGITNHESLLDPAIWRRFDIQIEIPTPSYDVTYHILEKFMSPLETDENELRFLSWIIEGGSGADTEMFAQWLKKCHVIAPDKSLLDWIREFAILNTGRIDIEKRDILIDENNLINTLLDASYLNLKQKDIASIFKIAPSTLSKQIAKNQKN